MLIIASIVLLAVIVAAVSGCGLILARRLLSLLEFAAAYPLLCAHGLR